MVKLVSLEPEDPAEDVIDALDQCRGKTDLISSIAISIVYRDGTIGNIRSTAPHTAALLGAIYRTAYDLNGDME